MAFSSQISYQSCAQLFSIFCRVQTRSQTLTATITQPPRRTLIVQLRTDRENVQNRLQLIADRCRSASSTVISLGGSGLQLLKRIMRTHGLCLSHCWYIMPQLYSRQPEDHPICKQSWASLLSAQVNSSSYPQRDGKWLIGSLLATRWRPNADDWGGGMPASCTPWVWRVQWMTE